MSPNSQTAAFEALLGACEGMARTGASATHIVEMIRAQRTSLCGPADSEAAPFDAEPMTPEVAEKSAKNIWDDIRDFIPVWKAAQEHKWHWFANSRCKYVELRIDMRDGGCIIRDRHRVRISPEQLAYQYKSDATSGSGG